MPKLDPITRINTLYSPVPESGCWIWDRAWDGSGYGMISCRGRPVAAHRFSYMVHKGDPGNLLVLHKCDTPACINPDHLFLGTSQDNMNDKVSKGRGKGPPVRAKCKNGHDFTDPNVYYSTSASGKVFRSCRACSLASQRNIQEKRRVKMNSIEGKYRG